jgi:hypothetical protein
MTLFALTQSLLLHTFTHAKELITLARHARAEKPAHLAWRILTVAAIAQTCTEDESSV